LPINQTFDLNARLGLLFADTEFSVRASALGFSESGSGSANSQDVFFGVGAGFNFGSNWRVTLDWQQFKDVGDDEETGEADGSRIALGGIYKLWFAPSDSRRGERRSPSHSGSVLRALIARQNRRSPAKRRGFVPESLSNLRMTL